MQSRLFESIGKRINQFLDPDLYELNRNATVNVAADKVKWSLSNTLKDDGDVVESKLRVAHELGPETVSLVTSTEESPTFALETERFKKYFNLTTAVSDPTVSLGVFRRESKDYSFDSTLEYDWEKSKMSLDVGFCWDGIDKLAFGAHVKALAERTQFKGIGEFEIGAEYNRNPDQTFMALVKGTSDNNFTLTIGDQVKLKDAITSFGKLKVNLNHELDYALGLSYKLGKSSFVDAVVRSGPDLVPNNGSVLYTNSMKDQKILAKVGVNVDLNKTLENRVAMQWKFVFGETFTADDFGALGDAGLLI